MAPVIVCGSNKGGAAKTTTAVNVAHGLAMRGLKVLIIDLDAQGNCSQLFGLLKNDVPLPPEVTVEPLFNGRASGATEAHGVHVVGWHPQSAPYGQMLGDIDRLERFEDGLAETIAAIKPDVTFIDLPPTNQGFMGPTVLRYTTHLIAPLLSGPKELSGVRNVIRFAAALNKRYTTSIQTLGVVSYRSKTTNKVLLKMYEDIDQEFGPLLFPHLPVSSVVTEAALMEQPVMVYEAACRDSDPKFGKYNERNWSFGRALMRVTEEVANRLSLALPLPDPHPAPKAKVGAES